MRCAHVKRLNPIRSLWHINDHINPITLFGVHVNTTFGFDNQNEFIRMEAKSVHVNVASGSTVKLWSYENTFCGKENENNYFIQQFLLFPVSLRCTFKIVPQRMRVMLLTQEPHSDVETWCTETCLQREECTRMHRDTLVNVHQRLTQKRRNSYSILFHYFCFLCTQKVFLYLHKIKVEPLMSNGLF